jgi:uncharacterized protein (DUF58 family)
MPTSRAFWFWITSLMFYFFANQTQIGWLYVVSALVFGVLLAAWWANHRALRRLQPARHLEARDAYHEDDTLTIDLSIHNPRRSASAFVMLHEACPLVAPQASERDLRLLFVSLPPGETHSSYAVILHQRGLHTFPPLQLSCRAPFGLFYRKVTYGIEQRLLVYPLVRPLAAYNLLDRQLASAWTSARLGMGSEVMGVRDYRQGDSLRHLHWRSIARRGQLISKEFADDSQPGLTLVLDSFCPGPLDDPKHNPFEWQVKVCASIGDYALRKRWPVSLLLPASDLVPPAGPLTWDSLLQILARVQPSTRDSLGDVVAHQALYGAVAVVCAWLTPTSVDPLLSLNRRGVRLQVVWADPSSFAGLAAGPEQRAAEALRGAGVEVVRLAWGQDWAEALAR